MCMTDVNLFLKTFLQCLLSSLAAHLLRFLILRVLGLSARICCIYKQAISQGLKPHLSYTEERAQRDVEGEFAIIENERRLLRSMQSFSIP